MARTLTRQPAPRHNGPAGEGQAGHREPANGWTGSSGHELCGPEQAGRGEHAIDQPVDGPVDIAHPNVYRELPATDGIEGGGHLGRERFD